MASKLVLVLIATGASAFVAPSTAAAPSTVLGADLTSMPGIGKETGDKPWDPYGFATKASTDTLGWYRAAEIKHGRVAMLAFTGFVVQSMGGGMIRSARGARAAVRGLRGARQLGGAGLIQIVLTIGFIELYSETIKPHYTKGGTPGYLPIIAPSGLAGDVDLRAANKELKNGRLAMIGMMGFFAAAAIPCSVPFLAGVSL
ncbi:chlorophyll A-B binding protein [Aureococcus anophagefferens]|nr:chlorophyll A-B binding protein [Aureococcus anophagefferens]